MTQTFVQYIVQYFDTHHTLDGGTVTKHFVDEEGARKYIGYITGEGTCAVHGPIKNCIRNLELTKRTSTMVREAIKI